MMSRSALATALVVSTLAGTASAQPAQTGQVPDTATSTPMMPGQGQGQPAQAGATDANAAAGKKTEPATPMAGYAYSDKVTVRSAPARARVRAPGAPAVNMPGFEALADGGSRLFVQLSQSVPVEERKAQGSITYVLKGATPRVWNNTNALVTVHFNTPVTRARLVPQGRDLLFVVELRAAATPVWKMSDAPDKGAMLAIDFPKGDYLDANGQPHETQAAATAAPGTTKPAETRGGRRGGRRGGAPPNNAAGPKP